jgi:hypothetical protein
LVASPPSADDIPCPPVVEVQGAEVCFMAVVDAYPKPSAMHSLPMPEIRLHIAINVVSHLNAAEEARSLSIEEPSLREFLLDQILVLQKH